MDVDHYIRHKGCTGGFKPIVNIGPGYGSQGPCGPRGGAAAALVRGWGYQDIQLCSLHLDFCLPLVPPSSYTSALPVDAARERTALGAPDRLPAGLALVMSLTQRVKA
jgi:hypothetical protein